MSFKLNDIADGGNTKKQPIEKGTYPSRVAGIAVLGVHSQEYMGEDKTPRKEMCLTYEMLDEFLKDEDGKDVRDKPRGLSERLAIYPLSSEKAKSTERYTALDQSMQYDGDFSALLTSPCMVTVGHTKNDNPKVLNVSAMRPKEAATAPKLVNEPMLFDFYEPTKESWESLPDWMKKVCKEALDFGGSGLEAMLSGGKKPAVKYQEVEQVDDKKVDW